MAQLIRASSASSSSSSATVATTTLNSVRRPVARVIDPLLIPKNVRSTAYMPWMTPEPAVTKRVRRNDTDATLSDVGTPDEPGERNAPGEWASALAKFDMFAQCEHPDADTVHWMPATSSALPDTIMGSSASSTSSSSSSGSSSSSSSVRTIF
jgi:hypothetical protein